MIRSLFQHQLVNERRSIAVVFLITVLFSAPFLTHAQEQGAQYIRGVQQLHRTPDTSYTKKTEHVRSAVKVTRIKNPVMRVLIGEAGAVNTFTANGTVVVEDAAHLQYHVGQANDVVSISYAAGVYTATMNGKTVTATEPLRVTPAKYRSEITVKSYENRPEWNRELNDNVFYGSVEVVWSEQSQKLLLVNELGIEKYVRGIAEASNNNHPEYLRSLLTAARTYALFNIINPTKHNGEPYILDATANDQVYRGAGFSLRAPNVVTAQQETVRQVIMYAGAPIIAPYFSQSDGRTRTWDEVWNGTYAWAQSVVDPCCTDRSLKGHGVGMSAAGARYFAEQQGWTWQQIVQYYYTDVVIEEAY